MSHQTGGPEFFGQVSGIPLFTLHVYLMAWVLLSSSLFPLSSTDGLDLGHAAVIDLPGAGEGGDGVCMPGEGIWTVTFLVDNLGLLWKIQDKSKPVLCFLVHT